MTIVFECKSNGKRLDVEDVKFFTTDCTFLGSTGYGVKYKDGTFSLYPYKEWELVLVKEE